MFKLHIIALSGYNDLGSILQYHVVLDSLNGSLIGGIGRREPQDDDFRQHRIHHDETFPYTVMG